MILTHPGRGASPGTVVIMSRAAREMPQEVSQVSLVPPPASTARALGTLESALGYLAAADATALGAEEQARCLLALERVSSAPASRMAARSSALIAAVAARWCSLPGGWGALGPAGHRARGDGAWLSQRLSQRACTRVYVQTRARGVR